GVARRIHDVEPEIAEVDQVAFFQPDIDIDRLVRFVEHLAQHREVVAQHDLVGGETVGGNDGAAAEAVGGADVVEMFVAENYHVDLIQPAAEVIEAFQQMDEVRGQPDIDHDGPRFAPHQIGVGGAILESDLVDLLGGLDQRADGIVEEN